MRGDVMQVEGQFEPRARCRDGLCQCHNIDQSWHKMQEHVVIVERQMIGETGHPAEVFVAQIQWDFGVTFLLARRSAPRNDVVIRLRQALTNTLSRLVVGMILKRRVGQ